MLKLAAFALKIGVLPKQRDELRSKIRIEDAVDDHVRGWVDDQQEMAGK